MTRTDNKITPNVLESGPRQVMLWRRLDPIRCGPWTTEKPKGGVIQHEVFISSTHHESELRGLAEELDARAAALRTTARVQRETENEYAAVGNLTRASESEFIASLLRDRVGQGEDG